MELPNNSHTSHIISLYIKDKQFGYPEGSQTVLHYWIIHQRQAVELSDFQLNLLWTKKFLQLSLKNSYSW